MSDVRKGYVSIHREILDHWVWNDKPVSRGQAWVDLILMANYKSQQFSYKDQVIEGKRGTVHRSITYLAERWGWGRDKASRFLRQLEADGMIVLNATTHRTTITIVNYGKYQDVQVSALPIGRRQVDNKPSSSRKQVGTYKKDNNVEKENKGNHSSDVQDGGQSPEEIEEANQWFESL